MQNHPPHNNSVQANHAVQMWFLYYMIKDSGYPDIKAQNENNDEAREGKRIWDANKADIIKRRNEQVIIAHPRSQFQLSMFNKQQAFSVMGIGASPVPLNNDRKAIGYLASSNWDEVQSLRSLSRAFAIIGPVRIYRHDQQSVINVMSISGINLAGSSTLDMEAFTNCEKNQKGDYANCTLKTEALTLAYQVLADFIISTAKSRQQKELVMPAMGSGYFISALAAEEKIKAQKIIQKAFLQAATKQQLTLYWFDYQKNQENSTPEKQDQYFHVVKGSDLIGFTLSLQADGKSVLLLNPKNDRTMGGDYQNEKNTSVEARLCRESDLLAVQALPFNASLQESFVKDEIKISYEAIMFSHYFMLQALGFMHDTMLNLDQFDARVGRLLWDASKANVMNLMGEQKMYCTQSFFDHVKPDDYFKTLGLAYRPMGAMELENNAITNENSNKLDQSLACLAPRPMANNANGLNELRTHSIHQLVIGPVPFYDFSEKKEEVLDVLTARAPNMMRSSPNDLAKYATPSADRKSYQLNEEAYQSACRELAQFMLTTAKKEGYQRIIMPAFGVGVYLNMLDAASKKRAYEIMYFAMAEAAKTQSIEVTWVVWAKEKETNLFFGHSPTAQVFALNQALANIDKDNVYMNAIVHKDLVTYAREQKKAHPNEKQVMVNAGSDRTVGGAATARNPHTMEEQLAQQSALLALHSRVNKGMCERFSHAKQNANKQLIQLPPLASFTVPVIQPVPHASSLSTQSQTDFFKPDPQATKPQQFSKNEKENCRIS